MTTPDPTPRPTTADLLDRLLADAETLRHGVDRLLEALDESVYPQCEGPLEAHGGGGAECMRCEWRWGR